MTKFNRIVESSLFFHEFYNHKISEAPSRGLSHHKECKKSHEVDRNSERNKDSRDSRPGLG